MPAVLRPFREPRAVLARSVVASAGTHDRFCDYRRAGVVRRDCRYRARGVGWEESQNNTAPLSTRSPIPRGQGR